MRRFLIWQAWTVGLLGTLAGAVPAGAADLPSIAEPPAPPAPAARPPLDFGAGWYLRGDIGASINDSPQLSIFPSPVGAPAISFTDPNYRGTFTSSTFPKTRVSPGGFADLGIGYQVAPWFRVDVTGEYRDGAILSAVGIIDDSGTTTGAGGPVGAHNSELSVYDKGRLSSAVLLANGYLDLGTYAGITPFVGAGIGVARNRVGKLTVSDVYSSTTGGGPPVSFPFGGTVASGSKTNLAWALMAGLGYAVTRNLKFEVGYRFLDLGQFRTGTETLVLGGQNVPVPAGGRGRDYFANDIRAGLRWSFDAGTGTIADLPVSSRF